MKIFANENFLKIFEKNPRILFVKTDFTLQRVAEI